MSALPILLAVWGAVFAGFVCVMIYRSNLTRHEADQLFLSETADHSNAHAENDEVIRKVHQIEPVVKGLGGAAVALTVTLIGTYIWSVLPYIRLNQ